MARESPEGGTPAVERAPETAVRGYYDAYWESEWVEVAAPLKLIELFASYVSAEDRCLDVGCGDGSASGPWLQEHAASYVGVDVSESAVLMVRARGLEAQPINDAAELPFPDDSFDFVVCAEVLEHLFDPQGAMAEINRVLRPGGRLIATVPNLAHWRNRVDALFGRWNPRGDHLSAREPWRDPHIRFFTVRSLATLMERCGFEVLERGGFAELAFLQYVPGLRRLARRSRPRSLGRRLAATFPSLLAGNVYAVGRLR